MKKDNDKKRRINPTDKEKLEGLLHGLLVEGNYSVVISIKGSWGIGKSYFWTEFSSRFQKEKYAYISLFGKTSIEEIKNSIILQTSEINKLFKVIRNKFGKIGFKGINIDSLLTMFEIKDFKDIVICFDDFDRISSKLDMRDIMGMISELKEQKKCKIVIINNFDQLISSDATNDTLIYTHLNDKKIRYSLRTTNNERTFRLFSEKIIDYTFNYSPSIKENYDLFKNKIKPFDKETILMYLESTVDKDDNLNINFNLRKLKQYIQFLNIFKFTLKYNIHKSILDSISANIFETHYNKNIKKSDFIKINLGYEINSLIKDSLSLNYVRNKEKFIEEIMLIHANIIVKTNNSETLDTIEKTYHRFTYDLNYRNNSFCDDLCYIFTEYDSNIIYLIGLYDFIFYMDLIKEVDSRDNDDKYTNFLIDNVIGYIDIENNKGRFFLNRQIKEISEKYAKIKEHIEYLMQDKPSETLDAHKADNLLTKITSKGAWSDEDEKAISNISAQQHVEFMTLSMDYLESSFKFYRWRMTLTNRSLLSEASVNIEKAFELLSSDNNEYKVKLKKLLDNHG